MLSALILSLLGCPALLLAKQPMHQRQVHPGPLVLRTASLKTPAPTTDRDRASDDTLQDKRLKQPKPSQTEAYHIGSIRIEGISGEEEKWIRKKIALRENSEVSPEEIDGTLAMLRGLNIFSRVEYRQSNEEPYDLVFMIEPNESRRISVGARFDTQDLASVIAQISYAHAG